jgi:hypothetical protein
MNSLAAALYRDPDKVEQLVFMSPRKDLVPSEALLEWLSLRTSIAEPLRQLVDTDRDFASVLHDARLPIVSVASWDQALGSAKAFPIFAHQPHEWVGFAPAPALGVGLTFPDDSHPAQRWSVFGGSPGRGLPLTIEVQGAGRPSWSLRDNRHCGLPERGTCDPGQCRTCRLRKRRAKPAGLICVCKHDAP